MKLAIIGNPAVGKSSLFFALVGKHFSRKKGYFSHIGTFVSKDRRVFELGNLIKSRKITPVNYEVGDFDGFGNLWKEEKTGEILQELITYDILIQVVDAFSGKDTESDFEDINLRLIFSDLQLTERRLSRLEKEVKARKGSEKELKILEKIYDTLSNEKPISSLGLSEQEKGIISGYSFLTIKPRIVFINIKEDNLSLECKEEYRGYPAICAPLNIEMELSEIEDEEERKELLEEYGLKDSAVHRLEETILKELGYIVFYTVGEKETRAWLLKKGATVYEAAGKIHSDIQRGFIRAEVIHYEDFIKTGSHKEAKNRNLMTIEGKEYVVQDGDVINIRFSI